MMMGLSSPSSSRKEAFMDFEYLVPSLKTWPTSMPLIASWTPSLHLGHLSPASAFRMSAMTSMDASRDSHTPFRW
jgi:hypothetical protein